MMYLDTNLHNDVLDVPSFRLDKFYTATVEQKINLLSLIKKEVQCVLVISKVGMGGTHLLAGYYKELKEESMSIHCEKFLHKYKNEGNTRLNLQGYKYLFLDDWHALYGMCEKENIPAIEFVESEIKNFVANGGKLFMKINLSQTPTSLYNYLSQFTKEEVRLEHIENSIKKKLLEDMFQSINEEKGSSKLVLEKDFEDELLSVECDSYRELQCHFICWVARNVHSK